MQVLEVVPGPTAQMPTLEQPWLKSLTLHSLLVCAGLWWLTVRSGACSIPLPSSLQMQRSAQGLAFQAELRLVYGRCSLVE